MSSLLYQLLHDVRQRCADLAQRLGRLQESVGPEAEPYRAKMEMRTRRVLNLINGLLNDPALRQPQLAVNYFRDYKRLTEKVQDVEEGPVLVLGRFSEDDGFMTRIVGRICREIGYPYNAPLCAALSTNYYWALPHMDLVFVPCLEPFHLLALADLYHELAHMLVFRNEAKLIRPGHGLVDQHFGRLIRDARQRNWPTGSIDCFNESRKTWKTNWCLEFASDMIATYCVGPAFGWCDVRLCTNLASNLFEGADSHPADDARTTAISFMLNKIGRQQDATALLARWAELIALAKETKPQGYDLAYPRDLLVDLVEFIATACASLGLRCWPTASTPGTIHVGTLLNNAWDVFRASPETFDQFEAVRLRELREELGLGN
jgi:hypothetical protein